LPDLKLISSFTLMDGYNPSCILRILLLSTETTQVGPIPKNLRVYEFNNSSQFCPTSTNLSKANYTGNSKRISNRDKSLES